MRENRTYGSEGGEGNLPDPYRAKKRSRRSAIDGEACYPLLNRAAVRLSRALERVPSR